MSLLPYIPAAWLVHREIALRQLAFPLYGGGEDTHFTVTRTYEGALATYTAAPLDTLDADFAGTVIACTGEADDDTLTLASAAALFTGCPVTISNVVTLTGITAGTYYAIRLSATTLKLAASAANAYAGTAVPISADGTCDLTLPTAYLVEQSPLADASADCVRYTRTFATVPGQWFDAGSFAYQFPGYSAGATGSGIAISSILASGANTIFGLGSSGSAVAGDVVLVNVSYTRDGLPYTQTFSAPAVATTNTSQVTVARTLPGSGAFGVFLTGTVSIFTPGRGEAQALVVPSRLQHDYVLSTAAAVGAALPPLAAFAPVYASGATAGQAAAVLDTTTLPTAASYAEQVAERAELVVESDLARYLGNIFERRTRLVPAS
jgi:hypothetical protein